MQENFTILNRGSSCGATHVPCQTPTILSPRNMPRCDSGLPRDTQSGTGTAGNVFERPPAQEGLSSTTFNNSKKLASSPQEWRPGTSGTTTKRERERVSEIKRESLKTSISVPHFQSGGGMLNHTGGIYSHCDMMDYPRIPIWEMHLGKCLDSMEFQCWKVNIRTEVCLRTADPQITMHWIKGVEIAMSILRTSDIAIDCGATWFPWLRYAWCDDCVCIEKASQHAGTLRKTVSVEQQRAQKHDRFLPRKTKLRTWSTSIFHATGAYEAVQELSDLFTFSLQNDDVQDFDVRWDQALLSVNEMPSDVILEGLYKSKVTEFCSASDCVGFVRSRNGARQWAELSTVENSCKTSHSSDDENSKLQGLERCCGKRISHQESKRKESLRWEESGRVFSVENTWTMSQRRLM